MFLSRQHVDAGGRRKPGFASLLGLLALALSLGVVPLPDAFGQRLFTWALVLVMSLVLVGSAKEADQATLLEDVLANG